MLRYFPALFSKINLWNRTKSRAEKLRDELNELFPDVSISVLNDSTECVADADVVVTATGSSAPLFRKGDLMKPTVHINGESGAGVELDVVE
jgi:ornithine cyclodeaminase/alanine dehydrogenase-like protein (mu-crystallin family)